MVRVISIEAFMSCWISNLKSVRSKGKRFRVQSLLYFLSPLTRGTLSIMTALRNWKALILLTNGEDKSFCENNGFQGTAGLGYANLMTANKESPIFTSLLAVQTLLSAPLRWLFVVPFNIFLLSLLPFLSLPYSTLSYSIVSSNGISKIIIIISFLHFVSIIMLPCAFSLLLV